jgi:hypothetical protein
VVDPLYRCYPPEFDENSNADMAALFGGFQRIAEGSNASVLICHHLSKGPQGDKATVDLGSGAGAQARAVDCLLGLRNHATEGAAAVSGVVRSYAPFADFTIQWSFPLWHPADDLDPADLRRPARRGKAKPPGPAASPCEPTAQPWTPERLTGEILTATPQPRGAILGAACAAGMRSERAAAKLLETAAASGLAFRWVLPGDKRRLHYAAVPQPALDGGTA